MQGPLAFATEVLRRRRQVLWFGLLAGIVCAATWNLSQPDIYQSRAVLRVLFAQLEEDDRLQAQRQRLIEAWDAKRAGKPPPPMTY